MMTNLVTRFIERLRSGFTAQPNGPTAQMSSIHLLIPHHQALALLELVGFLEHGAYVLILIQLYRLSHLLAPPRAPSVRLLFRDARATQAVLDFPRDTRVGRIPGLALFGFQGEESELEEIELVAQEEGLGSDNEEDGPGPP